ncbi:MULTISPECIES: cytochrome P450 [Streptomyces]|uniref:Cytochrome P450 n=1 Tax=Streptomyces doudnae TaxID=3075536 RepID=A0ABD5EY85_9ACTN|nr:MULTISPECIES: cytochrome P450 [unclassified Streptomyces]MDT0439658.1 cytochrome P450 [Streptomyces sp. DSM 41981]MYQ66180.1 cytochrome P450 [Streptomyces sp. SID4950]SCE15633.1 Cytochrome P450 [Streptomyces sp. SolWspMP-5a-2]
MPHDSDFDLPEQALDVDLTDEKLYASEAPERVWRTLRAIGRPVRSHGLRDHWAVTRYRHIEEVYRQGDRFSSEMGMHLGEKKSDTLAGPAAGGMSLLVTDDPAHGEMRRALGAAFTPRLMRKLADSTLDIARTLVAEAADGSPVDFVDAVAAPLPAIVICDLLGVPPSDRDHVLRLTRSAFSGSGYATSTSQLAAHAELFAYSDHLVREKRRTPGEDVATVLANATMYGRPMNREIAVMNCHDLIAGGNETTRHTSGAAALTMVTHRSAWQGLREGRTGLDGATEELLRFEAPVSHVMRVLLADTEIGGVTLRKGEYVTLWLRSANRDEDVFDHPDELRFDRAGSRHLTFGHGAHYCIAAALARIEVGAIVQALSEQIADAELAGVPRRLESNFFRGYRTVPLALTRR